jgi:gas vesicle protein
MRTGKLVWFVAGASIGATLTLLFAPQSGRATRRYLGKQARKGRAAIEDAGEEVLDKSRDLYKQGRHMAEDLAGEATALYDRGRRILEG